MHSICSMFGKYVFKLDGRCEVRDSGIVDDIGVKANLREKRQRLDEYAVYGSRC